MGPTADTLPPLIPITVDSLPFELTIGILLIYAIILAALILFIWEPIPIDITAIAIIVALIAFAPWLNLTITDSLSGFSSTATITVLAMFILSEGIRRTGVISVIGKRIADKYGTSYHRQLLAVLGLSGGAAGVINNTPVVAVMIPMVSDLSQRTGVSPSKLLLPISFAAMMGGMLTLIGTSTNLLASDIYSTMGPSFEPFTIFEFTSLGLIILLIGSLYLLTIGHRLIPERIKADQTLTSEFEMAEYLTEVTVNEDSPFVGQTIHDCLETLDIDVDIVQLIRGNTAYTEPLDRKQIRANDLLVLRTNREDLLTLIETEGLDLAPNADEQITDDTLIATEPLEEPEEQTLVEVVIAPDSTLHGRTLQDLNFRQRYDATVLAIRRGGRVIHARMDERSLRGGDTLLIQATEDTVHRLTTDRNFVVARQIDLPAYRREKLPLALSIVLGVVTIAGTGLAPIVHSALAGVVAMVATGCLHPREVYESVDWNVIFLLAGLIPLGLAMTRTGADQLIATIVLSYVDATQPLILLAVFYLLTAILTNAVSNNASVVLMIPIAVDVAITTGLNPFAFAIAVTFAASTAFMTPVGYQTNLMVYGPGGYQFTDYLRAGAPLQLLLAIVTVIGISMIWGVT